MAQWANAKMDSTCQPHPWRIILRLALGLSMLLVFWITSCAKRTQAPDLGQLYNAAAAAYDKNRNPVIVIPGVLGTKLVDEASGKIVWGAFGGEGINPTRAEDAKIFMLPIAGNGQKLTDAMDTVRTAGVLETMKVKFLGLPLELSAYIQILQTLGAGGYRDQSLGLSGAIDYGEDHFTCFQFDYDWRRDLPETAARLDQFIKEKAALVRKEYRERYGIDKPVTFDIVAHSMGGLITRYFLRYGNQDLESLGENPTPSWPGAEHVDKVIIVGTPNAGSLGALENLIEGRKFGPLIPRYRPALLGTFPSLYQLLPRPRHGAVVDIAHPEKGHLNHLDPALWFAMEWGLANPKEQAHLAKIFTDTMSEAQVKTRAEAYLERMLARAKLFFRAMDVPAELPEGLSLFLVIGDAEKTPATLGIDTMAKTSAVVKFGPGDGTVLRTSVFLDERQGGFWEPRLVSPIKFRQTLLLGKDHLGMTKDPTFKDNVLFYLLENP